MMLVLFCTRFVMLVNKLQFPSLAFSIDLSMDCSLVSLAALSLSGVKQVATDRQSNIYADSEQKHQVDGQVREGAVCLCGGHHPGFKSEIVIN